MQNTELKNLLIITISFTLLYIHHSIYFILLIFIRNNKFCNWCYQETIVIKKITIIIQIFILLKLSSYHILKVLKFFSNITKLREKKFKN